MPVIKQISAADTWDLRHRVMWPEQPFEYVQLAEDEAGIHFGLFENKQIISVISVFIVNNTAQFRKFATESSLQGQGYGSLLLQHIIQEISDRNIEHLWCNARVSAIGFYQKFGLEVVSDSWLKDGIEYVKMAMPLS